MPKITSIKGARGWGRRLKFIAYAPTAITQLVNTGYYGNNLVACPWGGGYSESMINYWNNQIAGGELAIIAPAPLGSQCPDAHGVAKYVAQYQTTYSCPLGGTYNATTGMCQ